MGELELSGFNRSPGVPPPPPPPPEPSVPPRADPPAGGPHPMRPAQAPARRPARSPGRRAATAVPSEARLTVNVEIATRRWIRDYARVVGMTLGEVVEAALEAHGAALRAEPATLRRLADPVPVHLVLPDGTRPRLEALRDEMGTTLSAIVAQLLARAQAAMSPDDVASAAARRLAGW